MTKDDMQAAIEIANFLNLKPNIALYDIEQDIRKNMKTYDKKIYRHTKIDDRYLDAKKKYEICQSSSSEKDLLYWSIKYLNYFNSILYSNNLEEYETVLNTKEYYCIQSAYEIVTQFKVNLILNDGSVKEKTLLKESLTLQQCEQLRELEEGYIFNIHHKTNDQEEKSLSNKLLISIIGVVAMLSYLLLILSKHLI